MDLRLLVVAQHGLQIASVSWPLALAMKRPNVITYTSFCPKQVKISFAKNLFILQKGELVHGYTTVVL